MGKLGTARRKRNIPVAILSAIIVAALAVRVVYIAQLSSSGMGDALSVDSRFYTSVAREIASGQSLPSGALTFNPLYPFFLAAIFRFFGDSLIAVRIVQSFLGLVTVLLVYVAARRLAKGERKSNLRGEYVAAIAAAMAVLYPVLLLYEGMILGTTLEVFLLVSSFALAIAIDQDLSGVEPLRLGRRRVPSWVATAILGALSGAGALARPNLFLLLIVGLLAWIVVRNSHGRVWLRPVLGFILGAFLFLAPPTLYNFRATGKLVPVTTHGGINFYIGNRQGSIGVYDVPGGLRGSMRGLVEDARARAEKESGRKMTDAEVSNFYMQKAISDIKKDSLGWVFLLVRKAVLLFNKVEIHDMPDVLFFQKTLPVISFLPLRFSIISPACIAGFIVLLLGRRNRSVVCLFLGCAIASVLLFYVNTRYRIPIVPVAMILAALFIVWLFSDISRKRFKLPLLLMAIAIAVFFGISSRTIVSANEASVYVYLGNYYMNKGEAENASQAFAEAYRLDPNLDVAIINYGRVMLQRGDYARAAELFSRGYALNPRYPRLAIEYAFSLDNLGRREEARGLYREVYETGGTDERVIACKALAQQAFFEGKKSEVLKWVRAGLEIAPRDNELAAMLQAAESMP